MKPASGLCTPAGLFPRMRLHPFAIGATLALLALALPVPTASAHDCAVYVEAESVVCKCPAFPPGAAYTHVIYVSGFRPIVCRHGEIPIPPVGAAPAGCGEGDVALVEDGELVCEAAGILRPGDPSLDAAAARAR